MFQSNRFDAVLNLAARAGVRYSITNPHIYFSTNVTGSLNILEAMRASGTKKYVLASTSSLYAGQSMPFVESLPVNCPISPYAASKKAAEALAYSYHHLFNIDCTILRYFTAYGPEGRPDMSYFKFIQSIDNGEKLELYGDGSQARDFTYVDDIALGTISAIRPLGFEIINLGGGDRPVTILEMIKKLEVLLGRPALIKKKPFHAADLKATSADISKARDLLRWKPATTLDQGLATTVEWYKKHQPWSSSITVKHES